MKWAIGIALLALVGLAGCTKTVEEMNYTERKALAEQIVKRCQEQGVKVGTKEMATCEHVEMQSEIATRHRRAAVEDAQAASSGPVFCNKVGNAVICT